MNLSSDRFSVVTGKKDFTSMDLSHCLMSPEAGFELTPERSYCSQDGGWHSDPLFRSHLLRRGVFDYEQDLMDANSGYFYPSFNYSQLDSPLFQPLMRIPAGAPIIIPRQDPLQAKLTPIETTASDVFVISFADFWQVITAKDGSVLAKDATKVAMPAGKEAFEVAKCLKDLNLAGTTRFYISRHRGVPYVVFKGNQKLRELFKGTRYGIMHTRVVSFQFSWKAAAHATISGLKTSVVFFGIGQVLDIAVSEILGEKKTWEDFVASGIIDLGFAALELAITTIAVAAAKRILISGATAAATMALGIPLVAGIAVGVVCAIGFYYVFEWADQHWKLKERLSNWLRNINWKPLLTYASMGYILSSSMMSLTYRNLAH